MTVTEAEFNAVAHAALEFFHLSQTETAFCLDELARKMNRELTNASTLSFRKHGPGIGPKPWAVESPLESAGLRKKKAVKP